jgi:hypothetical protein
LLLELKHRGSSIPPDRDLCPGVFGPAGQGLYHPQPTRGTAPAARGGGPGSGRRTLLRGRRLQRQRRGASHLLQGLVVCQSGGYAYCGIGPRAGRREYRYYRCSFLEQRDRGGERTCSNRQLQAGRPEEAVWDDVCTVLRDPKRVEAEFERRLNHDGLGESWEAEQLAGMIQRSERHCPTDRQLRGGTTGKARVRAAYPQCERTAGSPGG